MINLGYPTRNDMYSVFPRNGIGAEIGVRMGDNATWLWQVTKPDILYLVDCWDYCPNYVTVYDQLMNMHVVAELFHEELNSRRVRLIREESLRAIPYLPALDWCYLDGDHTKENVLAELIAIEGHIKPGGLIAGHDYMNTDAIGVKDAVEAFCKNYPWDLVIVTPEDHPSFVLIRRES